MLFLATLEGHTDGQLDERTAGTLLCFSCGHFLIISNKYDVNKIIFSLRSALNVGHGWRNRYCGSIVPKNEEFSPK